MLDIAKMISSFDEPRKESVMGNEAVARGAIEAGVKGVFAYPGTPSTEISEVFNHVSAFQNSPACKSKQLSPNSDPIYFEYSINEKVALEKAIAYSLGNRKAMCCMKNVGMNVASDPLMTITYQTIGASLVIVVCDDPGCFSSSNEQDSRYWGKMASVPVFNPSTPEDAINMTKDAFALSGLLKLPVIVRMTTRVSHSRGIVTVGRIDQTIQTPEFQESPQHINIPARTAIAHKNLLDKLESDLIVPFQRMSNTTTLDGSLESEGKSKHRFGIIASGVTVSYAKEIISNNELSDAIGLQKIGMTHPFPSEDVYRFLVNGFDRVLILEELDPIVEDEVRILAQRRNLNIEVYGKGYAGLSNIGEYGLALVGKAISEFTGLELAQKVPLPIEDARRFVNELPPRPPALCPGCPHRATFYALKLAMSRDKIKPVLCGDIGCFGLGALAPFQLIDTLHHMGMSISMAQGLSEAFHTDANDKRKTVAFVGDGTFFHSGVPSLLNAVYTRANITVVIFDNRTIGMTGQQDHPGAVNADDQEQVNLTSLLKGMGVQFVESIDPNNIRECFKVVEEALSFDGVAVVVAQSPCVFLPEFKDGINWNDKIEVDHALCNTCHNQDDLSICCSKENSPESTLVKARAKLLAVNNIPASEQLCPANICNHGFFTAIHEGDYKAALDIIRDKILFARVCGDICHKPCEFLFRGDGQPVVPIKRLKQFVAGIDTNFNDFGVQKARLDSKPKQGKTVAVIGAGPAGLSAAYDLVREGYDVTVFEKEEEAGGLLRYAIPGFRLDKEGYAKEISFLVELGVKFKYNTSLGRDIYLEQLAGEFDSVIVAIGMGLSTTLDVIEDGVDPEHKFDALTFLHKYNQNELDIDPASTVFVIGGGNSAIDAARAARQFGVDVVTVIYRRTREEMPAFDEEIEAAKAEGIRIINQSVIDTCSLDSDGKINVTLKSFKGGEHVGELKCDYIVTAIGQKGDVDDFNSAGLSVNKVDRITSDPQGGFATYENVFAAGDISADNHVSLIGAISSGKNAAARVRKLLEGYTYAYEGETALSMLNAHTRIGKESSQTEDGRLDESQIEAEIAGYNLFRACRKCDHCIENFGCPALIKVDGKVVIDDIQCTRCGLCIDVCINDAIHWSKQAESV